MGLTVGFNDENYELLGSSILSELSQEDATTTEKPNCQKSPCQLAKTKARGCDALKSLVCEHKH
jgi:hypothetical protein